MTIRLLRAATLLAAAVCSTLALAADPPSVVGRIAVAEGPVRIVGDSGDEAAGAQVNWPVTSHNVVSTARGARTEIRIGSTSLRLDGDTSVEVTELDDDSLRLRLNYGSINVRVRNGEVVRGFELETPNGVVRMQDVGAIRVDSERVPGVTAVTALLGTALVNDRGGQLIVRQGKRLDVGDDIRTGTAQLDGFDDWSGRRDQYEERSVSARYVTTEMTGYEDLDRHGVWRDDAEYGALWMPTTVASDWAPYRDGSWTWISPWGWTWVDNAPWGYAPFHYGRWVQVNQRWAWAPGRRIDRPVWAPALVGWVGGSSWNLNFNSGGRRPATGWYPLSPRDAFVPSYRISADHLQRINRDHDGRPNGGRDGRDGRDGREGDRRDFRGDQARQGLTVVPQAQFGQRGTVPVRNAPRFTGPLATPPVGAGAGAAPAAPAGAVVQRGRMDRDDWERNRPHRPEIGNNPVPAFQPGGPARSPLAPNQPQRNERNDRDERGPRQQAAAAPLMAPLPAQPLQRPQEPRRFDGQDQQRQLQQEQQRQQQDRQRQQFEQQRQQQQQQQDQQRQQQEQQRQQQEQQRQQQDQLRQQDVQRQQQEQQRQQQDRQRQQFDQRQQQDQQRQQFQQRQSQEQQRQQQEQQRAGRDDERGRGQRQPAPQPQPQPQPAAAPAPAPAPAPVRQVAPPPAAPAPVAAAPAAEPPRNRGNAERNAERRRGNDGAEANPR
jgi:hypothetical protein